MSGSADVHRLSLKLFDDPTALIYGIGNCGRQDDGLGWAFIDRLENSPAGPRACLRRTYQLMLEDADLITRFERVLFVDATKDPMVESFTVDRPEPKFDLSFTSHAVSVESILATAQQCFGYVPESYVLAVRGYQWELQEGLTRSAQINLGRSLDYFCEPALSA